MAGRRWTATELRDAQEQLRAGAPLDEVAERLGRTVPSVRDRAAYPAGLPGAVSRFRWPAADDAKLLQMIRDGVPAVRMAERLSRTVRSIRHRAYRHGLAVPLAPGRAPKWTRAELARLREMRAAGATYEVVAERLGRTGYAVKQRAHKIGIARPAPAWRRPWTADDDATLLRLVGSGLPWLDIGREMGRSDGSCAARWSRRYGYHRDRPEREPAPPTHRTDPVKIASTRFGEFGVLDW